MIFQSRPVAEQEVSPVEEVPDQGRESNEPVDVLLQLLHHLVRGHPGALARRSDHLRHVGLAELGGESWHVGNYAHGFIVVLLSVAVELLGHPLVEADGRAIPGMLVLACRGTAGHAAILALILGQRHREVDAATCWLSATSREAGTR